MIWPKHHSLLIEHNPHKDSYQTVEAYLLEYESIEQMNYEDYNKCLELNELWTCQFYPRTPISFIHIIVPTWERLIEEINKLGENG